MNIDLRTLVIHQVLLAMMLLMVVLMTKSIFENTFEIKNSKKNVLPSEGKRQK